MWITSVTTYQLKEEDELLLIASVLRRQRTAQHVMLSEQGENKIIFNHLLLSQPQGSQKHRPTTNPKQLTSCFIWQHAEELVPTTAAMTCPSQCGSYPVQSSN